MTCAVSRMRALLSCHLQEGLGGTLCDGPCAWQRWPCCDSLSRWGVLGDTAWSPGHFAVKMRSKRARELKTEVAPVAMMMWEVLDD